MSQTAAAPSRWERFKQSDFLYYFKRDKVAMASFTVFMLFLVMALAGTILSPTYPDGLSSIDN